MSRSTDYPRPSVKEYRANLEVIPKRDCSNTLAGPVKRTLKLGTWPSNGDKVTDALFEGVRPPKKSGFLKDLAKILSNRQGNCLHRFSCNYITQHFDPRDLFMMT